MRDEGVIYVACHPWLNRRCTRLPGCIRLRNDLYCVGWGVKLTHSLEIIPRRDSSTAGGGDPLCLDPHTNFRLARQRSHCCCFAVVFHFRESDPVLSFVASSSLTFNCGGSRLLCPLHVDHGTSFPVQFPRVLSVYSVMRDFRYCSLYYYYYYSYCYF